MQLKDSEQLKAAVDAASATAAYFQKVCFLLKWEEFL